jgi:hypothetical protein
MTATRKVRLDRFTVVHKSNRPCQKLRDTSRCPREIYERLGILLNGLQCEHDHI